MSSLTAAKITNLYLYGTKNPPASPTDVVRRSSDEGVFTQYSVGINDYMNNGPGRFISPAMFEIVQSFFAYESTIAPDEYNEQELAQILHPSKAYVAYRFL